MREKPECDGCDARPMKLTKVVFLLDQNNIPEGVLRGEWPPRHGMFIEQHLCDDCMIQRAREEKN